MDAFNENLNEQQAQQPMGCLHRFSKTIKPSVFVLQFVDVSYLLLFIYEQSYINYSRSQEIQLFILFKC